jgi:RNA polymerase sigma factor (sigma-70 family)
MAISEPLQDQQEPWVDCHTGKALLPGGQGYDWPTNPNQRTPSGMAEPPRSAPPSQAWVANQGEAESSFALLLRARDGDASARDELFTRYLPRLERWAHGRLPAWARGAVDTGDLVQDTLLQVFQKIGVFQPQHEGAFFAYLHQALMNRIRDEIRRAQRRGGPAESLDTEKPTLEASPLERAIGQEALENYEAALQRLKPGDREAIILRIELGLSVPEVAQALCKPSVAAAHMAISRALVRLTKEMSHGPRS